MNCSLRRVWFESYFAVRGWVILYIESRLGRKEKKRKGKPKRESHAESSRSRTWSWSWSSSWYYTIKSLSFCPSLNSIYHFLNSPYYFLHLLYHIPSLPLSTNQRFKLHVTSIFKHHLSVKRQWPRKKIIRRILLFLLPRLISFSFLFVDFYFLFLLLLLLLSLAPLCCTVLYCIALYSSVFCCTVLYCTVLHCTVMDWIELRCAVLSSSLPLSDVNHTNALQCSTTHHPQWLIDWFDYWFTNIIWPLHVTVATEYDVVC